VDFLFVKIRISRNALDRLDVHEWIVHSQCVTLSNKRNFGLLNILLDQ